MKLVLNSLILIVLFAGCDLFKKNIFSKRKYTKGYFIEAKNSNNELEVHNRKTTNTHTKLLKNQHKSLPNTSLNNNLVISKCCVEENTHYKSDVKGERNPVKETEKIYKILKDKSQSNNERNYLFVNNTFFSTGYADKLITTVDIKNSDSNALNAITFILYSFLFIILAIVYKVVILLKAHGFPLVLAIPIAIILALLTLITGIVFF